jgi:CheY-like chemotaxis protein
VVANSVESARPVIAAAGQKLSISLPAEPIFLDADLTRLAQVLSNLLTNSAKYTQPDGHIWLSAQRRGNEIEVEVKDDGIGIPEESLPHIFDMFSQVDRTIERSTGGLGIGLALVKGVVEMHGGEVYAASDGPGRGSTFTIKLPVIQRQVTATMDTSPKGEFQAMSRGRKILVVDDNRDSANSLAAFLRLLGHTVEMAHDGDEAVTVAGQFRPEVILMDVGMPKLNGYRATQEIRKQPWGRDIAIIALTGWGQESDRERSREANCDGHLVKPVNLSVLSKVVDQYATKREAGQISSTA